jgi:uncharacterized protein YndB with AHSA1/START domain
VTQDVVTASTRIRATPEEVFPYLTDPELLPLWLGEWADTNPEPGGRFAINFGDGKVRGTYVLISPPHRVAFTWGLHENTVLPEGCSTVEIYSPPTARKPSSTSPTAGCPSGNGRGTRKAGTCAWPSSPKRSTPEHQPLIERS